MWGFFVYVLFVLTWVCFIYSGHHYTGVYILVHGTWAGDELWHQAEGDFFKNLQHTVHMLRGKLVPFTWSGNLSHESRVEASVALEKLIVGYDPALPIYIIAHSHGANVGILASQLLADKKTHVIKAFYALGAPVNTKQYMPDMAVIEHYYNLYSTKDIIQPVLGLYDRVLPAHERIANIRILIEDKNPNHSGIHSPLVAYWIPFLHSHLANYTLGNFDKFSFNTLATIFFNDKRPPLYKPENSTEEPTERDNYISY